MDPLRHLYFHKYRINLKPRELLRLPEYKGSALRGVFGYALKRVVCVINKSRCDDCMLRFKCVYSAIMETPIPEDHPYQRKYKNAPHPYVIIPPLTRRRYFRPDDSIFFDIVLIGRANEYLPYFIYAFTEMGRIGVGKMKGKFDVVSAESLNYNGTEKEIFNSDSNVLKTSDNKIDYSFFVNQDFAGDEITISFVTPVRIKEENRLASDMPFHLLIRRLAERALLLSHLHCGAELEDCEEFIRDAKSVETVRNKLRWVDWERYSSRQQTKMKFGGLIGDITYKGDFQKYLPLLRLGEHIHVGKATTFGLGKYRIRSEK
jgi:CRISPR-associated endoribonuclease Cas6